MPNDTGLSRVPLHIDNLSQAIDIIRKYGDEKLNKRVDNLNKSVHYGEIIRTANKLIDNQNGPHQ